MATGLPPAVAWYCGLATGNAVENPEDSFSMFFWATIFKAWHSSAAHNVDEALKHWRAADYLLENGTETGGGINPELQALRHNPGTASGNVFSPPATEDSVFSFWLPSQAPDETTRYTSEMGDISEDSIQNVIENVLPGEHNDNIKEQRPHVMVMSTGRCGTMGLNSLFSNSNLQPHHSFLYMSRFPALFEFRARLYANNHDSVFAMAQWAATRAAEWLGEKPMIDLNHTDTTYAPVFAAIHKKSKFVYLRREPEKVFKSFYTKDQYSGGVGCFSPIRYTFDDWGRFLFNMPDCTDEYGIRYHIRQTEQFCRTFGNLMGDRWIEISSDKLFAQDKDEITRLLEFTGSDIPLDNAVEHFKTPVNVKAHRVCRSL